MIDIHSHILPAIDDGPSELETSLQMLNIAAENGTTTMIATPHFHEQIRPKKHKIIQKLDLLKEEAEKLNITLYAGMEVYLTPDTPQNLRKDNLLTLAGSNYLLVEFPFQQIPSYIDTILFEIMLQGKAPVIAHPERYTEIIENPNKMLKYLEKGALAQINSGSLLGYFGQEVQACAENLLTHGMVHFLGSDAHSTGRRKPILKQALQQIKEIAGEETANILSENAEKLINKKPILSSHRPIEKKNNTSFFNFFKLRNVR